MAHNCVRRVSIIYKREALVRKKKLSVNPYTRSLHLEHPRHPACACVPGLCASSASSGPYSSWRAAHAAPLKRRHASLAHFGGKLEEDFNLELDVFRVSKRLNDVLDDRSVEVGPSASLPTLDLPDDCEGVSLTKDVLLKRIESELDEHVLLKSSHLTDTNSCIEHLRGHGIHGWFASNLDDSLRTTFVSCDVPRLDCIFNCR